MDTSLQVLLLFISYIPLGLISGFLAGLLGIGGGIIVVPGLLLIFDILPFNQSMNYHMAVGTSLCIMLSTSISAVWQHRKYLDIDWSILKILTPGLIAGNLFAAYLFPHISRDMLTYLFITFMMAMLIKFITTKNPEKSVKTRRPATHLVPKIPGMFAGLLIGCIARLLGIGGGTMTTPFLHHYKIGMPHIIAISSFINMATAVLGTMASIYGGWGHADLPAHSLGYVYWPAALSVSIASFISVKSGVRYAHCLREKNSERFAYFADPCHYYQIPYLALNFTNSLMLNFPEIDPIAISLGPIDIRWYGIMYILGFGIAWLLAKHRINKGYLNISTQQLSDLVFYAALGAVLGGRVGYIFFYQFSEFINNPLILFKIWQGGMSFHGGMIGVIVSTWLFAKRLNIKFFNLMDFMAPVIAPGLGFGRLGNFIGGELWGRTTDLPWAMVFPYAGNVPRHPSQLYQFLLEGIILFIILWWFSSKKPPRMTVSGLFLLGYGSFRFIVEFFREPDGHLGTIAFNWLTMGQLLSVPMIGLGLFLLYRGYSRSEHV